MARRPGRGLFTVGGLLPDRARARFEAWSAAGAMLLVWVIGPVFGSGRHR
ncbi:hypothetical protein IIA16_03145 [bacterium]|nr:hypothetical protein [bacterium]